MDKEQFFERFPVSRETNERISCYAEMLREWNDRFNLVAPSTIEDMWQRHFWDSAQLADHLPTGDFRLADVGSGAGFPGLVLAIMGAPDVHLIESIGKKAEFLNNVVEKLDLSSVTVHQDRIEKMAPLQADVVTARALKALPELLGWLAPHVKKGGVALLLKGKKAEAELTEALKWATFTCDKIPSQTDPSGVILKIAHLKILPSYERRLLKQKKYVHQKR